MCELVPDHECKWVQEEIPVTSTECKIVQENECKTELEYRKLKECREVVVKKCRTVHEKVKEIVQVMPSK